MTDVEIRDVSPWYHLPDHGAHRVIKGPGFAFYQVPPLEDMVLQCCHWGEPCDWLGLGCG